MTGVSNRARVASARGSADDRLANEAALTHAVRVIEQVCWFAGRPDLIADQARTSRTAGLRAAIEAHDTGTLFDWLIGQFSYQGVSDRVARDYIHAHGAVTWADLDQALAGPAPCPKLGTYWQYYDCRYDKGSRTCAEPDHISGCPLPTHDLRNGRLNQLAYSLYLFVRDIANRDLVGWIDEQLADADIPGSGNRLGAMRAALVDPLRHVFGISDKVISMAFACLLIGAPKSRPRWLEVGPTMIAVDTLVHNFLVRTGILARFQAHHLYGPACYQPGGCADILAVVAAKIDASAFNPKFPKIFPRFVQSAIWRYCAQNGLNVCNGNRIDDDGQCENVYCRVRASCDRVPLRLRRRGQQ